MITKQAQNRSQYKRQWIYTDSARNAWSAIIEKYKIDNPDGTILLPAYIGWSSNEGSGIFDSVRLSGLKYDFYGLSLHLKIDITLFKQLVLKDKSQLVLLVHYFGFTDSQYNEITEWLIENDIFFVEDCAHAWLSDLVGGACGRKGAYSFYSLHKLLATNTGGMIVYNKSGENSSINKIPFFELNYDLYSIYFKRRSNFNYLTALLKDIEGIDIIYKVLDEGICPQTLPVIITNFDRNKLYFEMNERGFGMVSLYHTMISQLETVPFESVKITANKILNFPIHQDVSFNDLDEMVVVLKNILNV